MAVTTTERQNGTWNGLWQQAPQRDPFPRPDAEPALRCVECARLVKLRRAARKEHDGSTVVDTNIRIRLHGTGHGQRQPS
uniref:4Fe-4S Wbl-type domain-containing protein n=1 Tax=Streptomyces sp. NBC_00049 TaxID=2903617 RepID=A0AAU2JZ38_9ACTN